MNSFFVYQAFGIVVSGIVIAGVIYFLVRFVRTQERIAKSLEGIERLLKKDER